MRGLKFVAVAATVLIAASVPSFAADRPNNLNAASAQSESAAEAGDKVLGSELNDWVFTTVPSCPLLDTRPGSGVQGDGTGPINPGTPYAFNVKGLCGIPATAKAIAVNFIAIGAPGNGNLRVWPWDSSSPAQPNTAIITYTAGFNTSNAGDIGICNTATSTGGLCSDDLFIQTNVNSAHVKADVFGYFAPVSAPLGRAYAKVNSFGGGLDAARTRGFSSVTNPSTGVYCLTLTDPALSATDSPVIVNVEWDFSGGNDLLAFHSNSAFGCPGGTDVGVRTYNFPGGATALYNGVAFYVWIP